MPGQANSGTVHHGPAVVNNQQTTGSASLTQDDGFSTWIDANPGHSVDMELGFTRSLVDDLNSVSFNIGIHRSSPRQDDGPTPDSECEAVGQDRFPDRGIGTAVLLRL